jgi:phage tail-like protein
MSAAPPDPYRNFRFRVEIDSIAIAAFSECSIPESTTKDVDYREGTDQPTLTRKLSGRTTYGNITLKRGITDTLDLYNWQKSVQDMGAGGARKNISIVMVDETGQDKCRWNVSRAWPTKYESDQLKADGDEVVLETLEIVHEGIQRKS